MWFFGHSVLKSFLKTIFRESRPLDKWTNAGNDADAADCLVWSGSVSHYSPDVLVHAEALWSTGNEICRWFISCIVKASLPELNLQFREKGKATGNDRRIQMTVCSPQRRVWQLQCITPLVLFSSFNAAAMNRKLYKDKCCSCNIQWMLYYLKMNLKPNTLTPDGWNMNHTHLLLECEKTSFIFEVLMKCFWPLKKTFTSKEVHFHPDFFMTFFRTKMKKVVLWIFCLYSVQLQFIVTHSTKNDITKLHTTIIIICVLLLVLGLHVTLVLSLLSQFEYLY